MLLWIDIETTGLEAQSDVPLELGLRLTNDIGKDIDGKRRELKWLIWEAGENYQGAWEEMIPVVQDMHEKSGLAHDLSITDCWSRWEVDGQAVQTLTEWGVKPEDKVGLIGSSIGSLDRPFVIEHFPSLNIFVAYRNLDVSTLKELCRRHNKPLAERIEAEVGTKEDATHRVLEDIEASINEYKMYLDNFLFQAD